mgnify:CR=1 FL=1
MTLYKYTLYSFSHGDIICDELEGYEEKPKSYTRQNSTKRIPKDCIGNVIHDLPACWYLFLLERDDDKARELIADAIKKEIQEEERKFQEKKVALEEKLSEISK